ncbi:MAG TPA: SDR family oxidoreductase [Casimicrobiaceae bacterium]
MLQGKTALVTGSISGIGLGIARALARDGANIILNGFGDTKKIDALKNSIASEHAVEVRHDGAGEHGIAGLTKTVALEVAEHGITMNAICPGYVWTPLVQKQIPDTAKARGIGEQQVIRDVLLAAQPARKFVQVDEVAAFATFLVSDGASSITGAMLPIEGGWSAH